MPRKEPTVYVRGEFVPASKAHVKVYDLGIVLGATVTEMTRTFRHEPFRLDDHIARLYRSMKYCRIDPGYGPKKMRELTDRVVADNTKLISQDDELGIIHFVTPGENAVYAGAAGGANKLVPNVCIHTFNMPLYLWKKHFTMGARVATPGTRHVPPVCVDPKMKNRSRLHWWIADQETHDIDPEAMSLLLDLGGNIAECSGANFLIARDGQVLSPTPRNILQGVSRQVVKELCSDLAIPFIERDLQLYDVVNADEAFMSTTPWCICPVTYINNIRIGTRKMGPITKKLLSAWSKNVGVDIVKQITGSRRKR